MNVLVARAVTRRFGDVTAVDAVDLDVAAGEVVGLVGANGAGKTTLMRMVLGLLAPSAGSVRLFGEPPHREQRRRLGYVPQNLGLYPDLTVAENLDFRSAVLTTPGARSGVDAGRAHRPGDDRLVGGLSLGEQRVAAFRAATVHRPELLVLDEPTSGVSPLARSDLWELIRQHAEAGAAVLVSTHRMEEAEQSDRLLMMARGRVVARGTVDDVVGDRTAVEVRADRWADAFDVLDGSGDRLTLSGRAVRVLGLSVEQVRGVLVAAGVPAEVRSVPATLDETMVELDG